MCADLQFSHDAKTYLLKGLPLQLRAASIQEAVKLQKQADNAGQGSLAPATPNATPLIKIGTKTYAGADYIVALLGITRRTFNRWAQDRKGPPKIVIGQRVLYDLDKFATKLGEHGWCILNENDALTVQLCDQIYAGSLSYEAACKLLLESAVIVPDE